MKRFAKLYTTEEFGQILVTRDITEKDGVRIRFLNPYDDRSPCMVCLTDATGLLPSFAKKVFKNMTKDIAISHVDKGLDKWIDEQIPEFVHPEYKTARQC